MATVKFIIKGKDNPTNVIARFSNGRDCEFMRKTNLQVNRLHWDKEHGEIAKKKPNRDFINRQLRDLHSQIIDSFNTDYSNGKIITSDWLKRVISDFNRQDDEKGNLNFFSEYGKVFIENLPYRVNHSKGGQLGVSSRTVQKYNDIIKKVKVFEEYRKSKLLIADVNPKFQRDFFRFLKEVENHNDNYTGRIIGFIKTICLDAKSNGIKISEEFSKVRGFRRKAKFVYLSEEEIEKIARHDFSKKPFLDNARDWLIVGVCCGQRVSDFMTFTKETINDKGFLEFIQKKTKAKTLVPLHDLLGTILVKWDGQFPRRISEQNFNLYIKEVCKQVGLTEAVEGGKMNPKTKRKEYGAFPKYELVSSHICRRSFATNHYGKLPTSVLMSITNHSTEKMFLSYIGKTQADNAKILQDYWAKIREAKETEESPLEVVKDAG